MAAVAIAVPTRALRSKPVRVARPQFAVSPAAAASPVAPLRLTRRGRVVVAVVGVAALVLVLLGAGRLLGTGSAGSTAGAVRVVSVTHLVQPGDSLWSIARTVQPEGDVRPLVDRLSSARHGKPLLPGERIVVSVPV